MNLRTYFCIFSKQLLVFLGERASTMLVNDFKDTKYPKKVDISYLHLSFLVYNIKPFFGFQWSTENSMCPVTCY